MTVSPKTMVVQAKVQCIIRHSVLQGFEMTERMD